MIVALRASILIIRLRGAETFAGGGAALNTPHDVHKLIQSLKAQLFREPSIETLNPEPSRLVSYFVIPAPMNSENLQGYIQRIGRLKLNIG